MRTFFLFVIVFSLLVSCHQHHQERSEDQANQPVLSAVEKDSTDPAIQAFSQAVLAFQDGQFRQSTDQIVAGLEYMENLIPTASDTVDVATFRQTIQDLTLLAARLSRYEISDDREALDREFARARLDMSTLLLMATDFEEQAPVLISKRLDFCFEALKAAMPYLPGQTDEELRSLLLEKRQLGKNASSEQLLAFLHTTQLFLEKHKTEIFE